MVRRLTGPGRISANRLAEDVGVSQNTLSRWLREASKEKKVKRGNHSKARPVRPEDLSPAEKLQLVIEAANLSEEELGEFLRHRGRQRLFLHREGQTHRHS